MSSNTIKALQTIKTKKEFCSVDRLFSRREKKDLYKELDDEWGLDWDDVLKGVGTFFQKYQANMM